MSEGDPQERARHQARSQPGDDEVIDPKITAILSDVSRDDDSAPQRLFAAVYDELRQIARQRLSVLRPGNTLQTTALVNEAYLKMFGSNGGAPSFANRGEFYAAAARSMRNILVDALRHRGRQKRGGDWRRVTLTPVDQGVGADPVDILDLDEALTEFEGVDRTAHTVVSLRYFAGLSIAETAGALAVSSATVDRKWTFAKAWLHKRLELGTRGA